jgi:hypothetical protein
MASRPSRRLLATLAVKIFWQMHGENRKLSTAKNAKNVRKGAEKTTLGTLPRLSTYLRRWART